MLKPSEQDALYRLISAILGEDTSIKVRKSQFNESTVRVVEEMIAANEKCNENMKTLVRNLVGGAAALSRGWLRKLLKTSKKSLNNVELQGAGCMVSVKSRWKTKIIRSAIMN